MNRVYKFKHPAAPKHQGVGPELEEHVAMTDLDTKHVEVAHEEERLMWATKWTTKTTSSCSCFVSQHKPW